MATTTSPGGADARTPDPYGYVVGTPHPQTQGYASFEYKAHAPGNTGGGYPRWRSTEWRPHTAARDKEDVYVPVHRLCAVAWCLPDGTLGDDVRLSDLDGVDVHHNLGMPAANVDPASPNFDPDDALEVVDHGTHAERTQAQVRAWAEDAKRSARDDGPTDDDRCGRCGAADGSLWACDDYEGVRCTECAKVDSDGAALEVAGCLN